MRSVLPATAIVLALFVSPAFAQQGQINGVISDTTGAVVPGGIGPRCRGRSVPPPGHEVGADAALYGAWQGKAPMSPIGGACRRSGFTLRQVAPVTVSVTMTSSAKLVPAA